MLKLEIDYLIKWYLMYICLLLSWNTRFFSGACWETCTFYNESFFVFFEKW